ncbi:MAG: fatty acid desaturase [Steroidobacterales bacterium]
MQTATDTGANASGTAAPEDPFDVWYAPQLDYAVLRTLMRRTDKHGLTRFAAWIVLCGATGFLVVATLHSWWLIPAMFVHGCALSFSYAASHECAHGTAFRTRWLNEAVFWLTSLVFIEEPLYRRYSHAGHHTYTWFNALDPQKPYGIPMTLWQYLTVTLGLSFYFDAARQLARHSSGRFSAQELAFLPASEVRRVTLDSRIMAACYLALLAWGIAFRSPWPFVLYFIPRLLGGWIINLYINTQHMCMGEDQYDHRQTTRSIRCGPIGRLLYWNMNYHIEHHLYPTVPFHALPALNRRIDRQLPTASVSVLAVNSAIVRAIARQRREPGFHLGPAA